MVRALVVGGGPSLDLEFVKNFRGTLLVCDTVLKKCVDYGIKPGIVFTLEDISIFWKLFEGAKACPVICSTRTHVNTLNYLKHYGFGIIVVNWEYIHLISNVGMMAFCYAWRELKIDEISLIGLDSCVYGPVINPHSLPYDFVYREIINPDGVKCYLDPIHQVWHEQFIDFLKFAPDDLKILNYSNGCLFGEKIKWCPLSRSIQN